MHASNKIKINQTILQAIQNHMSFIFPICETIKYHSFLHTYPKYTNNSINQKLVLGSTFLLYKIKI